MRPYNLHPCRPNVEGNGVQAHLQAWLATSPHEPGRSLTVLEALDVGKAAFGALLT